MRRQIFKRSYFRLTIFTTLLFVFFLNIFGQRAPTQKCAETDYDCLIAKYDDEIKLNPNAAEAYYQRGTILVYKNEYDQAMKDYNKAISLNPKFEKAYSGRGYIYLQGMHYADALREFNRAKEFNPKDSYVTDNLIYIYEVIKQGGLPLEEYDKLIQVKPNKAEYYFFRSKLHFRAKDFDKAIEDSSKAIELNPKYIEAYAIRSDSYCEVGKSKESNADIARYEGLSGRKTNAVCKVCVLKPIDCQINDLTEEIVLEIKKEFPTKLNSLYNGRGILYYRKGDYDSALTDFNKTEDKYGFVASSLYRGDIYLRKGKYDEALVDFTQYLKNNPASIQINLNVGEIYLNKREYEKAFEYFDRVIFLSPVQSKAYFARGTIYLERAENYSETGNDEIKAAEAYKNAVKDFDSVIKLDLKEINPEVYIRRAKAFEKLGEREKADADRRKFEELSQKP